MAVFSSMRTWILVHVLSYIFGMALGLWLTWDEEVTEEDLMFAPWTGLDASPDWVLIPLIFVIAIFGVLQIAGLAGMYLYRRWGRTLTLVLTPLSLGLILLFPSEPLHGADAVWWEIATMAFGAALYAAYWGPSAARFSSVIQTEGKH